MAYALVFSGQGGQHPAMLPWLERDDVVRAVEDLLGRDWRVRLDDPAWAGNNRHAQVLLTGMAVAAWQQLAARLPRPAIVTGYSVGELGAFAAAGVYGADAALGLAAARAQAMDAAAAGQDTGLLGVTGATHDGLGPWCERFGLELAIRIGPGSAVVGGLRASLDAAAAAAPALGLRCTALNIAMASHTRWMAAASEAFAGALADVPMARPSTVLHSGAIGRVRDPAQAREALAVQISRTVQWDGCMDAIAAQRVDAVLEVGPGAALSRMWTERHPGIPVRSVDEFRTASAVVQWVLGQG